MDDGRPKSYLDQMTISIVSYLEKKSGVCQVKNEVKAPAERPAVLMWEQKNSLLLPEDLKNFFLTSNGFNLTWCVKMDSTTIPVGRMHVNTVGQLVRLESGANEGTHVQPSLWDLDMEEEINGRKAPSFCDSRIYELDPCDGYGKVCLVYNETSQADYVTEIWFLDRSLRWHYMCDSFQAYYRLMLMHLGLPQWQYAFTDIGLPPHSKQWFNMYAPIRLEVDTESVIDVATHSEISGKAAASPLDLNKIFKGKSDRKKIVGPQTSTNSNASSGIAKRKPPVSSASAISRSSTSLGKPSGPSPSQVAVKTSR